jgi:hypothetical protein
MMAHNFMKRVIKARESEWAIAYRKKKDGAIFEFEKQSFSLISNTIRYWCADPFLVEEGNRTYIFCEVFDRFKRKGFLGFREINEGEVGNIHIIIEEPHHLSYPFVYHEENNWFIIPETREANEIARYRAIEFPYRWEKEKVLVDHIASVDNTLFSIAPGNVKLFAYIWETFNKGELQIINLKGDSNQIIAQISDTNGRKRPAGKIFMINDVYYRPSQLSERTYGEAVIFNKIIAFKENVYQEEEFKIMGVDSLKLDTDRKITGVHTYNCSENWEVIDVEIGGFSILRTFSLLPRLYSHIKKMKENNNLSHS